MDNKEQLIKEIEEYFDDKGIDKINSKIIDWYNFVIGQMKNSSYYTPCEDCDNLNCKSADRTWYCPYQQ